MNTIEMSQEDQTVLDGLDFDIEELESLDAPGFWKGFKDGIFIGGAVVAAVGVGIAIT